jgi:MinD-like ATPase involved in chromosome partitioning or flagellar assembly
VSLICFCSFKGSPGATLTALTTAAAWPTGETTDRVLVEADPDGGALAIRYQMPSKPGLLSLAVASRRGLDAERLWDHAQTLPGGLPVVLGPDGPGQASEVLRGSGARLGEWFASLEGIDVLVDVGRLSVGSPATDLVASADVVLAVARPVADQLQPAAHRLQALQTHGGLNVGWVLIGSQPYGPASIENAYGIPVVHVVADDPRTVRRIETGTAPNRVRRSPLVRSVTDLADELSRLAVTRTGRAELPARSGVPAGNGTTADPPAARDASVPGAVEEPVVNPATTHTATPRTPPTQPATPEPGSGAGYEPAGGDRRADVTAPAPHRPATNPAPVSRSGQPTGPTVEWPWPVERDQ